jgi:hypothetical protein
MGKIYITCLDFFLRLEKLLHHFRSRWPQHCSKKMFENSHSSSKTILRLKSKRIVYIFTFEMDVSSQRKTAFFASAECHASNSRWSDTQSSEIALCSPPNRKTIGITFPLSRSLALSLTLSRSLDLSLSLTLSAAIRKRKLFSCRQKT